MEITCKTCGYPAVFVEELSANTVDSSYPDILVSVFKCIHCSYYNVLLTEELAQELTDFEEKLQQYYASLTTG